MNKSKTESFFNELYNKTFNEAYGYTLAKTGDPVATTEMLKSSYSTLLQMLLKNNNIENGRAILFKIIRENLALYNQKSLNSAHPKTTRIKKYAQFLEDELEMEIDSPQNQAQLKEILDQILSFIAQKPELQRRAFLLHYLYDFTVEQVAAELSLSETESGNYIYNLTKEIREMLQAKASNEQEEEN